ncbi:EamA family transporter [Albidovulum sp.]
MLQIVAGYSFALACAVIVILGDVLLKHAADRDHALHSPHIVSAVLLYAASAMAWYLAMRHISLAQAGVAYTMFSLLALCAIGALVFGEPVEAREWAGIACAVSAVLLMVRFA